MFTDKRITEKTSLKDILAGDWVKGWEFMVDPGLDGMLKDKMGQEDETVFREEAFAELPLGRIPERMGAWAVPPIISGLNYLQERAEQGEVFYPIYTPEEQKEDPSKAKAGLSAFPASGKDTSAGRNEPRRPFVIICPGGGYSSVCSIAEGFPIAMRLNQLGYSAFVLQYRVGEVPLFPLPLQDLAQALRFIRSHARLFDIDPDRYILAGFSAGGHLAALFCLEAYGARAFSLPAPSMLILGYPVITMLGNAHSGSRSRLLGDDPSPEMLRSLSVELAAGAAFPAAYLWQCEEDDTVPCANSRMLADRLSACGIPCRYETFPGTAHGWGLGTGTAADGWLDRAMEFWREQERLPKEA